MTTNGFTYQTSSISSSGLMRTTFYIKERERNNNSEQLALNYCSIKGEWETAGGNCCAHLIEKRKVRQSVQSLSDFKQHSECFLFLFEEHFWMHTLKLEFILFYFPLSFTIASWQQRKLNFKITIAGRK